MNEQEASEYAMEHGGASFSICPVCDDHLLRRPDSMPLMHEAGIYEHAAGHSTLEWATALVNSVREAQLEAYRDAFQIARTFRDPSDEIARVVLGRFGVDLRADAN